MSARQLDRGGTVPLWRQLQHDLMARLRAGEFRDAFPSELAITTEYQVSRHTVRQALRQLRDSGLVSWTRGRPSRVAPPPGIEQPLGLLYSMFAAAEAAGLPIRAKVRIFGVRADGVIAPRLGLEESVPLLFLDRIWLAGGQPLALDQVWLPASFAGPLLEADFTRCRLYQELAARCGIRLDSGEERISAVSLAGLQCRLLDCSPQTGAFAVRRLGRAQGQPIEWRHLLIRGDRIPLTATFAARSGYRLSQPGSG